MSKLMKFAIIAGVLILTGLSAMQTDFVQHRAGMAEKSLNTKRLKEDKLSDKNMPQDLKGKIFDRDGNTVEEINNENMEYLYNSDGIHVIVNNDGTVLTDQMIVDKLEENKIENSNYMTAVSNLDDLQNHLSFEVKFPQYIPQGFEFIRAECVDYEKTECGIITWYNLEFQNRQTTKFMNIQVMQLGKNQKAEDVLDTINNAEEGKINDKCARITSDCITWIDGDIMYEIFSDSLDKEERMKVAESIK